MELLICLHAPEINIHKPTGALSWYTIRPSAGAAIAVLWAEDIRGINTPLVVDVTSRAELAAGVVVPMPTWACTNGVAARNKTVRIVSLLFIVYICVLKNTK
jgi:hypothetical protein